MKQLVKEYCTPDKLCYEKLGLNHNWRHDCYPFITTSQGIVYGDEGDKHSDMTYRVIAQIVGCEIDDVINVKNEEYDYYPDGKEDEGDGYELRNITYHFRDKNEGRIIWIDLYFQDGSRGDFNCIYEPNVIRKELLSYGVHEEILDELVNDIMNQKYTIEVYGGFWLDIDEEPQGGSDEPYFAIDGEEVSENLINEILYYLNDDGKYELTDYTYDYGRIWVEIGENYESYISLWLNQRLDWDRKMDNGKIKDDDRTYALRNNTFDVFDANYDTWDNGSHVPSSLSDDTIESCIEVFKHFGCDLENSFIAIGDTVLPVLKVHNKEEQFTINDDDIKKSEEERAIHLLPPEQKRETDQIKGFISDRNAKWNKKLMGHDLDGNETGVMPMAKYNFYKKYGLGDSRQIQGNLVENETQYHPEEQDEYKIGFDGLGNADDFGHIQQENTIKKIYIPENKLYLIKEGISKILYHFTTLDGLIMILNDNAIKGDYLDKISFTRNYNSTIGYPSQHNPHNTHQDDFDRCVVRLTVDGEALSYNYKGEPYDDFGKMRTNTRSSIKSKNTIDKMNPQVESEDRVDVSKHNGGIHGIINYIKKVDILFRNVPINWVDEYVNELDELRELEVNVNVFFNEKDFNKKGLVGYSIEEAMYMLRERNLEESKSLIKENITDIVYHFTDIYSAVRILKTNYLKTHGENGSGYYISVTRQRNCNIGFAKDMYVDDGDCFVRFQLDGYTLNLNNQLKAKPWDFWGQDFNSYSLKKDNRHHSEIPTRKQRLKLEPEQINNIESEDRIECKTSTLKDIVKYITRIDVAIRSMRLDKQEIIYLCNNAKEKGILDKVFIYYDKKEFNAQSNICLTGEEFWKKYVLIDENLEYEVKPSEVDVSSFERQNELQPEIWQNNQLNPQLRLKLLDIADDFYNSLEISWVKPIDIILTGSICNFNWSKYSDIDLHIVIDYSEVSEQTDFVKTFLDAKKNQWNEQHDTLEMFGFPVELYVQDISEDAVSSGVYSLEKDEWLKEPNFNEMSMEDINRSDLKEKAASIMTYIDDIEERFNSTEDKHQLEELNDEIEHLTKKLKEIRTSYLDKDGEISLGNLVYKILRRTEYLDKIWNISDKIYDKINSID